MPGIGFTFGTAGNSRRLNRQLNALSGSIKERQKNARFLGGRVAKDAKQNVRNQRTVAGRAFSPRKVKRKKKALLTGLAKRIKVISKAKEGGGVVVTWPNSFEAGIAGRHQWGIGEDWTPKKMREVRGSPHYSKPCTLDQAKALKREGFRLTRKGKPAKAVSVKQLQEMFTVGRAGVILRYMRTKSLKGKQHWKDTVPVRDFLGVTPERADEMSAELARKVLENTTKGS